ncbi:SEC-C metal-binding domain-containing protein [Micromonospora mirobrigensis]|uniref:SEC-C metal-binding domain-containing protein n=1 Tax=Micromonospora mirobrigensis TaxID=262898 RepID=UPI003CCBBD7D
MSVADEAAALEAEVEQYPDERGEILLEAADAWRRAGRFDRAADLLTGLIADGGGDGCYAMVQLAEVRFEQGDVDEAYVVLDGLAHDAAMDDGHCTLVAELLAERGDLHGALRWYDRAVACLSAEELQALGGADGWMQMSSVMIRGRREVRRELGLAPDVTDELAPAAPPQRQRLVDADGVRDAVASGRVPRQVRTLIFQRQERAEARRRWPQEHDMTDDEHYQAAERRWRELANGGVPAIRVVPATVADLCEFADRTGESPLDPALKVRYSETLPEEHTIAWPPPRNSPCWCGSTAKYKKCCGRTA